MVWIFVFAGIAIVGLILSYILTRKLHFNIMLMALQKRKIPDIIDEYKRLCIKYDVSPVDDPHRLLLEVLRHVRRRNTVSKQEQHSDSKET